MSTPSFSARASHFEKSATRPSSPFWRAFSPSARLDLSALKAFSNSSFSTSARARSMSCPIFATSAPISWAVRMSPSVSDRVRSSSPRSSAVTVSRHSFVKPIAISKSFDSMADRARDSRSSIGPTSRPRFFAAKIRLWAFENDPERCSWRIFSHRFQTFFARSIAVS